MKIWTTYTPQKISWEITYALTKGNAADSNWLNQRPLIERSLKLLHESGIYGIRLVIYPHEITFDGKQFDWKPIDTMLILCQKFNLLVDLCIGPFQYPNYPGIYLPKALLQYVFDDPNTIDTRNALRRFGETFLEKQLERYGEDKRIRGFHFANEWPDLQRVFGKEAIRTGISTSFMLQNAAFLKQNTTKPISLNTNIDASDKKKLLKVFGELLGGLEDQGRLGFDIYPSQHTWRKAFRQKLLRFFEPYQKSYQWSCKTFSLCEMFFCEVEAQPWGGGQSWYTLIKREAKPQIKVLQYTRQSLPQTFAIYINPSKPYEVSLWGADFWLCAKELGITWPLEQIKELAKAHQ